MKPVELLSTISVKINLMTHRQVTIYCDVSCCMPHCLNGRLGCKVINHAVIPKETSSFNRLFQSPYGILLLKLKVLQRSQLG